MTLLAALVLSLVEGLTEFLPVSSTGHLILTARLLRIPQTEFVKSFEIFIQLGAISAAAALYGKSIIRSRQLQRQLLLAFLPTAVIGFILYQPVKYYLIGNTPVTLLALFVGGLVLIGFESIFSKLSLKQTSLSGLSAKKSLLVGLVQALSIVPGVSRAAATIVGGLVVGLNRVSAVEFSFLLAVPTMAAAAGLDLVKSSFQFSLQEWFLLGVGFAGAFISARLAIFYFLSFVKTNSLAAFGYYRVLLAFLYATVVGW